MKKVFFSGLIALVLSAGPAGCGFDDDDDLDPRIERANQEGIIVITVTAGEDLQKPVYTWSFEEDITAGLLSVAAVDDPGNPGWEITSTQDLISSPVIHGITPDGVSVPHSALLALDLDVWYRVTVSKNSIPGSSSSSDFCLIGSGCPAHPG
ncbi:MAG TPA: hypothetical protein VLB09_02725 [Nitrospiria bacterium]|nr:hypothetical protein [Nitrospiria bacterium]